MSALTEPLRARILLVLEGNELTVTELGSVFQLPQSTMSRHLKSLTDEGWLTFRAEGTTRRYRMILDRLAPESRSLWELVRTAASALPAADQDRERLRSILDERRSRSAAFFATAAGEWDRMRGELLGRRLDLLALLGLLDERWSVADLGCGTGQVSAALAPFVREVLAIDASAAMLAAARERLAVHQNVQLRSGELEALPIPDLYCDAAILFLVLHYLPDPLAALREVVRILKPGGRVLIVDLTPHDREDYRQAMSHVWLGFSAEQCQAWASEVQLEDGRYLMLPADPDAKGPGLFCFSGRTPREEIWIPGALGGAT